MSIMLHKLIEFEIVFIQHYRSSFLSNVKKLTTKTLPINKNNASHHLMKHQTQMNFNLTMSRRLNNEIRCILIFINSIRITKFTMSGSLNRHSLSCLDKHDKLMHFCKLCTSNVLELNCILHKE